MDGNDPLPAPSSRSQTPDPSNPRYMGILFFLQQIHRELNDSRRVAQTLVRQETLPFRPALPESVWVAQQQEAKFRGVGRADDCQNPLTTAPTRFFHKPSRLKLPHACGVGRQARGLSLREEEPVGSSIRDPGIPARGRSRLAVASHDRTTDCTDVTDRWGIAEAGTPTTTLPADRPLACGVHLGDGRLSQASAPEAEVALLLARGQHRQAVPGGRFDDLEAPRVAAAG
jgi:hypothetical protein